MINVCGCGSSGTTLFAHLLDRHPKIVTGDELSLFSRSIFYKKYNLIKFMPFLINKYGLVSNINSFGFSKKEFFDLMKESKDIVQLTEEIEDHLINLTGKSIWAEKTPKNIKTIDLFIDTFPKAKVINLIRDPRDVTLSLMGRGYSFEQAIERWLTALARIQPYRDSNNVLEIKYENLVIDFENVMKKVCCFLEVEFENNYFQSEEYTSKKLKKFSGFDSWNLKPSEGISQKSIGKFKKSEYDFSSIYNIRLSNEFANELNIKKYSVLDFIKKYNYEVFNKEDIKPLQNKKIYPDYSEFFIKRKILDIILDENSFYPKIIM